jgi:hypothetical protein
MNLDKVFLTVVAVIVLMTHSALAETCCQKAAAAGKECKNKCCIAAHKEGKSCSKCNPNKEDLKLKKVQKTSEKNTKSQKP